MQEVDQTAKVVLYLMKEHDFGEKTIKRLGGTVISLAQDQHLKFMGPFCLKSIVIELVLESEVAIHIQGLKGLGGLASALGYGAYMYKNRGQMSTSVYLMQLRVTAQSAVVIALLGGVTYSLITQYVLSPKEKDKK
ncbi:hypothetical protein QYM36_003384 [Artemia franciscana]|uniref:HIG1 domain-containing protein n=1 Tax=Artemia franciscana TaxID=6661 RepID=A0AA88HZM1_ARTSF|nr:hypothetical protein QYM36_003384 [Artemia franciscana]